MEITLCKSEFNDDLDMSIMDDLTLIKSKTPDKVCKIFSLDETGGLAKEAIANISEGRAKRIHASGAMTLVEILKLVTERQNLVLCPGVWHGSQAGREFGLTTEKKLCDLLDDKIGKVRGGVIDHRGQLISARLARGIDYSNWLLLDADNPSGIPHNWAKMGIAERLQLWEPFVPGISRCERIEARSSSARVVKDGDTPGERSHAWIRVSDPDKIPILKAHIQVQMVLHDCSFTFGRRSRADPQKVIGSEHRSVFDLAVFDKGRLVFCAKPDISSDGYSIVDADVTMLNEGGGKLDLSSFSLPPASDLRRHKSKTNQNLEFTLSGTGVQSVETGLLTLDTEIEVKGIVRPLSGWVNQMVKGDKIRCESPFRESQSEAAFIKLSESGQPFVYDIGNSTKYVIAARSAEDVTNDCGALTEASTGDITAALVEIAGLEPIDAEKALKAIKASTGLAMGALRQQLATVAGADGIIVGEKPDQLSLARQTLSHIGAGKVIYAEQFFWLWNNAGVWKRADDRSVKQYVVNVMETAKLSVTAPTVGGTTDLAKTVAFRSGHRFNLGDPETINCLNGEVRLRNGRWELGGHNPEHFRTAQIPVHYDSEAKAPRFELFLDQIYDGDADKSEKIVATLELMGYTLMTHAKHEKFVLLKGTGSNGKSKIIGTLEALCGTDNISGVQPSKFDSPFQRAHMQYKLANLVTELKQGEVLADAELKAITSGEPATVEHKNKDPFVMRPYATCWFGTNHLPHTRDFSEAFFRRAVVLDFNRVFGEQEKDSNLLDKLTAELSGILNLCLDAYASALEFGFTDPSSSKVAKQKWRLETDQVQQFVSENCLMGPSYTIKSSLLYSTYKSWAFENGIKKTLGSRNFVERLERIGYGRVRRNDAVYVSGLKSN